MRYIISARSALISCSAFKIGTVVPDCMIATSSYYVTSRQHRLFLWKEIKVAALVARKCGFSTIYSRLEQNIVTVV